MTGINKLKYILGFIRAPFLVLAPACTLLGLATAVHSAVGINFSHAVLAFIGAISAHISVNTFNEYFDFKSGLDSRTNRTPFSGGSGTLQARPELAGLAFGTAAASCGLVALIGLYFLFVRGPLILPIGIAGLIIVATYTPRLVCNPYLCLLAPGLGFGILTVMGTDFALTGRYSAAAFFASLVPFFLVSDLLLLNQFPDVEADRTVGRKNLPILIGRRSASLVYGIFLLLAYLSLAAGVISGYLPAGALAGLFTIVLAVPASIGAYRHADDMKKLAPYLAINVIINIATPVLAAIGILTR